jgi:hypothetical protein
MVAGPPLLCALNIIRLYMWPRRRLFDRYTHHLSPVFSLPVIHFLQSYSYSYGGKSGKGGKSSSKGGKGGSSKGGKGGYSYSYGYGSGKSGKGSKGKSGKGSKGGYSYGYSRD